MESLRSMTREMAATRIETFAKEGRLVQCIWHRTYADGREIACLLGAIHPDINSADECPADIMPEWMSRTILWLFDYISRDKIEDYGFRFARALRYGKTNERVMAQTLIASMNCAIEAVAKIQSDPTLSRWTELYLVCKRVVSILSAGSTEQELASLRCELIRMCEENAIAHPAEASLARVARFAINAIGSSFVENPFIYVPSAVDHATGVCGYAAYIAAKANAAAPVRSRAQEKATLAAREHIFDALIDAMMAGVTVDPIVSVSSIER